jgi:hypothetical protein
MTGPYQYPESFPRPPFTPPGAPGQAAQPYPPQPYPAQPYPASGSAYPGMLPPPMQYPKRRRWRRIAGVLLALVVIAAVVAGIAYAIRGDTADTGGGPLSDESARAAIQEYLDALSDGDDETIARHTLCGLFDAVSERRSDLSLANLASDAFRKQFSRAEVSSIDKVVPWSANQAQVLFTMRVAPAGGPTRGEQSPREEEQGVAQLLIQGSGQDQEILVCSYLLRTGQY